MNSKKHYLKKTKISTISQKTNAINSFWDWFSVNCQAFEMNMENEVLLRELDKQVSNLGDFDWEIGPGISKEYSLVVSPNGDINLLPSTKMIISSAIGSSRWEFFYAKPPKQWDLFFYFETIIGRVIEIDAKDWKYILKEISNSLFDITVQAVGLEKEDATDKHAIVEIVLDGQLGEELRMTTIDNIEIVSHINDDMSKHATNIRNLLNHVKHLK